MVEVTVIVSCRIHDPDPVIVRLLKLEPLVVIVLPAEAPVKATVLAPAVKVPPFVQEPPTPISLLLAERVPVLNVKLSFTVRDDPGIV